MNQSELRNFASLQRIKNPREAKRSEVALVAHGKLEYAVMPQGEGETS